MEVNDIARLLETDGEFVRSWFYGNFMGSKEEPLGLINFIKKLKSELPKYGATPLYRYLYLEYDSIIKIEQAESVKIVTAPHARKTQSWTDDFDAALEFRSIGKDYGGKKYFKKECIVKANIPGDKILFSTEDLFKLVTKVYMEHTIDFEEENKPDDVFYTRNALEDYLPQKEWVLYLDTKIDVSELYVYDYKGKHLMRVATDPKEVTIVIDDPDTGEAHIEYPNVVPFEKPEQQQLQHAAKLLRR